MAETFCAMCGINPLGKKKSANVPGADRPKGQNAAFPRNIVEREVRQILQKHAGKLTQVDANLERALLGRDNNDKLAWQAIPGFGIKAKPAVGGMHVDPGFGMMIRASRRIKMRMPFMWQALGRQGGRLGDRVSLNRQTGGLPHIPWGRKVFRVLNPEHERLKLSHNNIDLGSLGGCILPPPVLESRQSQQSAACMLTPVLE